MDLLWKIGSMAIVVGVVALFVYLNKTDEKRAIKNAKDAAIRDKELQKLQEYYNTEEWLHGHD